MHVLSNFVPAYTQRQPLVVLLQVINFIQAMGTVVINDLIASSYIIPQSSKHESG